MEYHAGVEHDFANAGQVLRSGCALVEPFPPTRGMGWLLSLPDSVAVHLFAGAGKRDDPGIRFAQGLHGTHC
jgi:hypothetical protein